MEVATVPLKNWTILSDKLGEANFLHYPGGKVKL